MKNYYQCEDGTIHEIDSSTINLYLARRDITKIVLQDMPNLEVLNCNNNNLTSLDVSGCPNLKVLNCYYSKLTSLDVSRRSNLEKLFCYSNNLKSLDVSGCSKLIRVECENNKLTSLDVSGCPNLKVLNCYNNNLTSLDVSDCSELESLFCYYNILTSLDVSGCHKLIRADCETNNLTSLDVSGRSKLLRLDCEQNILTSLDVSGCSELEKLFIDTSVKITKDGKDNYVAIDGILSEYLSKKERDGYLIYNTVKHGYVVIKDNISAHGKTLKKAMADYHFKYQQEHVDKSEIVALIKKKGTVNWLDYRLLTGACESMTLAFLAEHNLDEASEVSIEKAIEITSGRYNSEQFKKLLS